MTAAEKVFPTSIELQSWSMLREQYPDEWLCLTDIEDTPEGVLHAGRVIDHDPSVLELIERIGTQSGATIVHTWGRRLNPPRIVMTDELDEFLHSRQ